MTWLEQLGPVFGPAAAVVISMLIMALLYQSKRLSAEQDAHHLTRKEHATALERINDKVTAALLANAMNTAQMTELLRSKSSQ